MVDRLVCLSRIPVKTMLGNVCIPWAMCLYFGLVGLVNLVTPISSVNAAPPPDFVLESGKWEQMSIPGDASGLSIESLFADDLPAAQYNADWFIFLWDASTQNYVNPGLAGSIPTGHGFWMIQLTGSPVTLDVPDIDSAPVQMSAACSSSNGCSEISLSAGDTYALNMIGSALPLAHEMESVRVVTDAAGGVCANGCSPSAATELGLVGSSVWQYDSSTGNYRNLASAGELGPWQSAWIVARPELAGSNTRYLFPTSPTVVGQGECLAAPVLPPLEESDPGKTVVQVSTEAQLQNAMANLTANTVILIDPGTYQLSQTLWVRQDNVTIRGNSNRCDAVRLQGMGMENAAGVNSVPHGVWTDADNLKVQNLAIEEVWYHPISIDAAAQAPQVYNVLMLNAGEQFVKVNSPGGAGSGSDNGRVEYSVMKYTDGPPRTDHGGGIGYTQGVDIHRGTNWLVSNNRFENFHTPDDADHLWSPVVHAWNFASDTVIENNVFIDVDRAISLGLNSRANDHTGGIVRNNTVVQRENLFSAARRANADAPIIIWSSPNAQVLHNTVLTNDNSPYAIQLRFDSNGTIVRNNLIDHPVHDRSNNQFVAENNVLFDDPSIFVDAANGDLHLANEVSGITDAVPTLEAVPRDIDGQSRNSGITDAGADQYSP